MSEVEGRDHYVEPVVLREMAWTDIPTLARLDAVLFEHDAWSEATWWSELAGRPRRDYLVATGPDASGSPVVGYGGLDHGDTADLMTIAVAPEARGTGLGGRLLTALTGRARARGAAAMMLEVRSDNSAARALYARHGFEEVAVRRRYYQPGDVDALVLRAHLLPCAATGSIDVTEETR